VEDGKQKVGIKKMGRGSVEVRGKKSRGLKLNLIGKKNFFSFFFFLLMNFDF
jgi:hypothetical protein